MTSQRATTYGVRVEKRILRHSKQDRNWRNITQRTVKDLPVSRELTGDRQRQRAVQYAQQWKYQSIITFCPQAPSPNYYRVRQCGLGDTSTPSGFMS